MAAKNNAGGEVVNLGKKEYEVDTDDASVKPIIDLSEDSSLQLRMDVNNNEASNFSIKKKTDLTNEENLALHQEIEGDHNDVSEVFFAVQENGTLEKLALIDIDDHEESDPEFFEPEDSTTHIPEEANAEPLIHKVLDSECENFPRKTKERLGDILATNSHSLGEQCKTPMQVVKSDMEQQIERQGSRSANEDEKKLLVKHAQEVEERLENYLNKNQLEFLPKRGSGAYAVPVTPYSSTETLEDAVVDSGSLDATDLRPIESDEYYDSIILSESDEVYDMSFSSDLNLINKNSSDSNNAIPSTGNSEYELRPSPSFQYKVETLYSAPSIEEGRTWHTDSNNNVDHETAPIKNEEIVQPKKSVTFNLDSKHSPIHERLASDVKQGIIRNTLSVHDTPRHDLPGDVSNILNYDLNGTNNISKPKPKSNNKIHGKSSTLTRGLRGIVNLFPSHHQHQQSPSAGKNCQAKVELGRRPTQNHRDSLELLRESSQMSSRDTVGNQQKKQEAGRKRWTLPRIFWFPKSR